MDVTRILAIGRRWWWLLILGTLFSVAAYGVTTTLRGARVHSGDVTAQARSERAL